VRDEVGNGKHTVQLDNYDTKTYNCKIQYTQRYINNYAKLRNKTSFCYSSAKIG